MADFKQIKIGSTTYAVKDETAIKTANQALEKANSISGGSSVSYDSSTETIVFK